MWGKAGQRSLERSALAEAAEQLTRALDQIATLPATPALRREEIKLQVALITPLIHVKGYAAPETKAAAERARLLIEQAEALGEPPEDPLLLFSVLYGFWVANLSSHSTAMSCANSRRSSCAGEKQEATFPLMIGHRLMGNVIAVYGRFRGRPSALRSRDRALRSCRASSAGDAFWPRHPGRNLVLSAVGLWMLGYPEAALADADRALKLAREIGPCRHTDVCTGLDVLHAISTAETTRQQKRMWMNLSRWRTKKAPCSGRRVGMVLQGCLLALTGKASDAVHMLTSGIAAWRRPDQHFGAVVCCHIWRKPMRNSANSTRLGAALARRAPWWKRPRKIGTRPSHPRCRRDRADVAAAGCGESASVFRACASGCARAAGKVVGTPRRR